MKKKMIGLLLVGTMAISLAACGTTGSSGSSTASSVTSFSATSGAFDTAAPMSTSGTSVTDTTAEPTDGSYKIVMIAKSIATDNWQMFGAGCQAAADELGSDKVELSFDGASDANAYEEQLSMIENYISSGCDAISVAPCSSESVIPTLTQAHQNGMVIGITDTAVDFDDYDNFTAFDNYAAGEMAAEAMVNDLKDRGVDTEGKKLIMICPVPGVQTLDDRMAGFQDKVGKIAPELEIVDPYYCDGDNNKALSNAQDAWQAYGEDIVGMFGLDEGVTDAISRCMDENELQGKFTITGIDATTLACNDVEKGNVKAVIGMSMYDMGYTATMNMYKILAGEDVEKDTVLENTEVTKDNMNDDDIRKIWDITSLQ